MEVLQALLTPTIATIAVYIGWRQWTTAREKLVLDLFEKRWAIFEGAEKAAGLVLRDGDVRNNTATRDIAILRSKTQFLFGPEVEKYLASLQEAMAKIGYAQDMMEASQQGQTVASEQSFPKMKMDAIMRVGRFHSEGVEIFAPYMIMTAKTQPNVFSQWAQRAGTKWSLWRSTKI